MKRRERVRLDLNNLEFQRQLFELSKQDQRQALLTFRKLFQMTWEQVYRDAGLKWEAISSRTDPGGVRLYSLRLGKGFRAVSARELPEAPIPAPGSRLGLSSMMAAAGI